MSPDEITPAFRSDLATLAKKLSYLESIGVLTFDDFYNNVIPESISSLTEFRDLFYKQELQETIDPTYLIGNLETFKTQWCRKGKALT